MLKAPCQNCEDRHKGCHSTCSKYRIYKVKHEHEMKKLREKKDFEFGFMEKAVEYKYSCKKYKR